MPSRFFHYRRSTLHFTSFGTGPKTLLMFHGFGQDNNIYHALARILSHQYTLFVFDLYFHGQSVWGHDEAPLEKNHWKETIEEFLKENNIQFFSLAGFSLGGKFVLATVEALPHRTKEIILLAPDGIKTSFWYSLATYPFLFRKIFKSMIYQPNRFLSLTRTLNKLGLIDKSVIKFAEFQMNSVEKRSRVYYSWVVFRHLHFDLGRIAELINQNKIPTTVVVGQYDKVIKPKAMEGFLKKLHHYRFETPEVGHTGLIAVSGPYFHALSAE
jgi:pimeloyl-ACP methyl ester carboxylesterase